MDDERDLLLANLRAEISNRLKPVCQQWPPEMFEEMVRGLAALTLKYDHKAGVATYDRRATERLIEEMKQLAERSKANRNE